MRRKLTWEYWLIKKVTDTFMNSDKTVIYHTMEEALEKYADVDDSKPFEEFVKNAFIIEDEVDISKLEKEFEKIYKKN